VKKLYFLLTSCIICFSSIADVTAIDSLFKVLNQEKTQKKKAFLFNELSVEFQENSPESMSIYAKKALNIGIKIKDDFIIGTAHQNIGTSNIILGNYTLALQNFIDAKNTFEKYPPHQVHSKLEKLRFP